MSINALIVGAYGQVGQELFRALKMRPGIGKIVCADIRPPPAHLKIDTHETIDALDKAALFSLIDKYQITDLYSLAALLSATGEIDPLKTQRINMKGLFNCLEAGKVGKVKKIFWPSSIAAFGENTPKDTPQLTIMEPSTVYGITKKTGQLWCSYYNRRYGVDVRSIRYPGLVGYRSPPGGGTTDYAVSIFHSAVLGETFQCYLEPNTPLPMIYTDDAIEGTIQLMQAPKQSITIRTSYNMQGMTFTPQQIASEIKKNLPKFEIQYKIQPLRQKIANSWPYGLEDNDARKDWGWSPKFNLERMTKQILKNLTPEMIKSMKH